jgi:hypothetical protein
MTKKEQRVAIAEACGWTATVDDDQFWRATRADGSMTSDLWCSMSNVWNAGIPDYLNDLNAMHEVEKVLFDRNDWSACIYDKHLHEATSAWKWNATASQRAEAFLRTIGKWKETK